MEIKGSNPDFLFQSVTLIGIGLIGSSIARAIKKTEYIVKNLVLTDADKLVRAKAKKLGLADSVEDNLCAAVVGADCVILCTPIGNYAEIMESISGQNIV